MSSLLPVGVRNDFCQPPQVEVKDAGERGSLILSAVSALSSRFRWKEPPLSQCSDPEIFRRIDLLEQRGNSEEEVDRAFAELSSRPFSIDTVIGIVNRKGKEIPAGERRLIEQSKRDLPDLNKALVSYDLIRRETDRMDLTRFKRLELRAGDEVFEAFGISGSEFRFVVHSAERTERPIGNIPLKRAASGFICASVISDESPHFYFEGSNFALVLSVDPSRIAATMRTDGYTPYLEGDNPKEFYRFYRRLQLLTGTVDRIYRELGVAPIPSSDQYSRFYRLKSLQEAGALPGEETLAADLERSIRNDAPHRGDIHDSYRFLGTTAHKLREILYFLKDRPDLCTAKRLREIRLCEQFLSEIRADSSIFRDHIHSIYGVGDLLAQTPFIDSRPMHDYDSFTYNEIDIDLSAPYGNGGFPVGVRAVLINEQAFAKFPFSFLNVLRDAKANGVPILFREEYPIPNEPDQVKARVFEEVRKANRKGVLKCIETGHIDERTAGEALLLALRLGMLNCAEALLEKCRMPEVCYREAFRKAFAARDFESLKRIVQHPQSGTRDLILEWAQGNPDWFPLFLIEFVVDSECEIPLNEDRFAERGTVSLESLINAADSLSRGSASVSLVAKKIGKIAPSIDPSKAMFIAKLAYAGMKDAEYHPFLLELLSSIPEPECSRVSFFLSDYIQMSGNRRKFGQFGQLNILDDLLRNSSSSIAHPYWSCFSRVSSLPGRILAGTLGVFSSCRRASGCRLKQS